MGYVFWTKFGVTIDLAAVAAAAVNLTENLNISVKLLRGMYATQSIFETDLGWTLGSVQLVEKCVMYHGNITPRIEINRL